MSTQPELTTERLVLRPFVATDAKDVQRLAGDIRIAATTEHIPHPYEDGMAEEWIDGQSNNWASGRSMTIACCLGINGPLAGCCGLEINRMNKRATLGYWIGVAYWGRGIGTEAAGALVNFGFTELGLNRIEAQHLITNPASGRIMQKIGMTHEVTLQRYAMRAGEYVDVEQYVCFAGGA